MNPKQILTLIATFLGAVYGAGIIVRRVCGQCGTWKRRITWILAFLVVNWGIQLAIGLAGRFVGGMAGKVAKAGAAAQQQQQPQKQQQKQQQSQ